MCLRGLKYKNSGFIGVLIGFCEVLGSVAGEREPTSVLSLPVFAELCV